MVAACKPRKQEGAQSCSIITLGAFSLSQMSSAKLA